jgi:uracil-DNA glycosylase family 4
MVVAETPMHYDITYDKPFGGRGLKEVRAFLESKGIKAHYTYASKCPKPSKDYKIKDAQTKVCSKRFLTEEIQRVKPKHIICLGAKAMYGAWGKTGISEKTGNKHYDAKLDAHIYPTVHQAQALYNEDMRQVLFQDLERFCQWIDGDADSQPVEFTPPIYIASTLKALRKMQRLIRESGGKVAVDIETNMLSSHKPDSEIRCIQFCWDAEFGGVFVPLEIGDGCYYEEEHEEEKTNRRTKEVYMAKMIKQFRASFWDEGESLEEAVEIIREILLESKCVWHNGKFDRIWLHTWGKRRFGKPIRAPHIYMDTIHVAHLINENRRLKLKTLIQTELGFPTYDIADKLTKNIDILIPYATKDTVATLLLSQKYEEWLAQPENRRLRKLYKKLIRPMDAIYTEIELEGWPVCGKTAKEIKESLEEKIKAVEEEMLAILKKKGIPVDPARNKEGYIAEFTSPHKLGPIIFDHLGYMPSNDPTIALTETGARSTNEDALVHLKEHKFVELLLEFRGLTKALSTYVVPMLRAANGRGKISTSYKQHGTTTGRTASGKEKDKKSNAKDDEAMNLQNLPHEHGIKKIVRAPEGWSILQVDFSQIELRVAGELSQDERSKAKPVNFGYLYGMFEKKFRQYALTDYGINFTMEECKEIRAQYYRDHHGLPQWYKKQIAEASTLGYVTSLTGRRRHLPNAMGTADSREKQRTQREAHRQAINTPVQGFASDLKQMAMVEIREKVSRKIARMLGEIHDSVLLLVRNEHVEEVAAIVVNIMRKPRLLDELGITFSLPIEAEAEAGPSLGEAKEIKVAA